MDKIQEIQNKIALGMSSCATCRQDCYGCDSLNFPQEIADQIRSIVGNGNQSAKACPKCDGYGETRHFGGRANVNCVNDPISEPCLYCDETGIDPDNPPVTIGVGKDG